ncbi:MAG: type II toxin-antitoxin system RelE/ParE family toxin [Elusimicrobiota bacterium]|jgi:proteic killer suppression protein|nr:type II toxin-antitoxin system RelE/ParE family toxin [Elusimicrobiota bacterium]
MIKSFADKETILIWKGEFSRKMPADIQKIILRKLIMIQAAANLRDLQIPPSNKLEKLQGDRIGYYSIRVNNRWRICFIWKDGNAFEIQTIDYH